MRLILSLLNILSTSLAIVNAQSTPPEPPAQVIEAVLNGIVSSFTANHSISLQHYPSEVGLAWENVSFTSTDGIPLKGWFIPRRGFNKIIIANHPRWFNRAGVNERPQDEVILAGNWWEVNFIPDYKILHDAGYNILAYDLRNHGESGVTGKFTSGLEESRDVVASINYIRNRPDTRGMIIGLFSRCGGASSNLHATRFYPDAFKDIRVMVLNQPISARAILTRGLERSNISTTRLDSDLDPRIFRAIGYHLDELRGAISSPFVKIPTYLYGVYDDFWTRPTDLQSVFDGIPIQDKKLYWIRGTDRRWDGYSWFQRNPQDIMAWIAKYMA